MIIDNFAGGGGTSTGLELAFGRPVDVAINHDPVALGMHQMNHPWTQHLVEDIWSVDPLKITNGRSVSLVWLSPDCTHFSKAKGAVPKSKTIRGLAWVALRWAALCKPRVIILENVEEFKTWGPLDKEGRIIKSKIGKTFASFIRQLKEHGYSVDHKVMKACDFGAPTIRKRFFLIARSDGLPIVWPEPTHGKGLIPYRTASEIINWGLPVRSIFDRKKPLSDATCKRIARGIEKFVINNKEPFLIKTGKHGNHERPIDKPLTTVLASCNKDCLVVPKFTPFIINNNFSNSGSLLNHPLPTVTSQSNRNGLIMPLLAPYRIDYHFSNKSRSLLEPWNTITTVRGEYLVAPTLMPVKKSCEEETEMMAAALIQTGYGENKKQNQKPRILDLNKPLSTVVSSCHQALVACHIDRAYKCYGSASGDAINRPLGTITTVNKSSLVVSFIDKYFGGNYKGSGSSLKEPLGTVTSIDHNNLVTAFLDKYYGGISYGQDVQTPLGTITTRERFSLITINEVNYVITDIGMRMLEPRELYNAQGFPPDYIIDRTFSGAKISRTKQIAACGNSVPPVFSEALGRANLPERAVSKRINTMQEFSDQIVENCFQ